MHQTIISADNPKLKTLKKLQQKKYRDELEQFVVENPLTIRDGLAHDAVPTEVYVTQSCLDRHTDVWGRISRAVTEKSIYIVDERALESASVLEQSQGIIGVYTMPHRQLDMSQSMVILTGVSDPGNVGTIIRTAAAFGIAQVSLDMDSADPYNPKVISAAKEAVFSVTTVRQKQAGMSEIHKHMPLYGLDVRGTVAVDAVQWKKPCGIVMGSEVHGIADDACGHIDTFIAVKMSGAVESLNVAVSAAIVMNSFFSAQ